jgi:hypothetical protein
MDGSEGLIAILVSGNFDRPGVTFFTGPELSQQAAFIKHRKGLVIQPHIHLVCAREVKRTQEVLIVRKGRLRADFYLSTREHFCSRELVAGDVLVLVGGGHGFEVLEDVEVVEVKQGPYLDESSDKVRFTGITQ